MSTIETHRTKPDLENAPLVVGIDKLSLRKAAFDLPCADQFWLACHVAENVGYVLAREPEHPDSPHVAVDDAALEAATKAIYEDKGDRKGILYVGWESEPEAVKEQWRVDVRFSVASYLAALVDRQYCPRPVLSDPTAKACILAGECGCDNQDHFTLPEPPK